MTGVEPEETHSVMDSRLDWLEWHIGGISVAYRGISVTVTEL